MKRFIFLAAFISYRVVATAQTVSGKIMNINSEPVEFANVILLNEIDSAFIQGVVSDEQGKFTLLLPNSRKDFLMKISHIGYKTVYCKTHADSIHNITVNADALIEDVVVKGNGLAIDMDNDGLSVNVRKSMLKHVGTADKLTGMLPGVNYDNGVFNVFGKGEAKIYVDGRELKDLSMLENINSTDIQTVKTIMNPGVKYGAEVNAVISITTKRRDSQWGVDVRSAYGRGRNSSFTEQANLNRHTDKLDLFGTFKYTRTPQEQDSEMSQETYADVTWTQDNMMTHKYVSNSYNAVAGFNYMPSARHSLGMQYSLILSPKYRKTTLMSSEIFKDGSYWGTYNTVDNDDCHKKPYHLLNVFYNGTFGKLSVDFNADFLRNGMTNAAEVTETEKDAESININSSNYVRNKMYAAKLVLEYPVFNGKLSAGGEYSATLRVDRYINKNESLPSTLSDIDEYNASAFFEYGSMTSIGMVKAGVRYENTNFEYSENGIMIETKSRRYDNLYPYLSLSTQIGKVRLLMEYATKTQRPKYSQLGNNITYGNRFTLYKGNPLLKPSTKKDITLSGMFSCIQFMASWQHISDDIVYCAEQFEDNAAVSVISHENANKRDCMTLYVMTAPKIAFYHPSLSVSMLKQWFSTQSNSTTVSMNKPIFQVKLNNSLELPGKFIFMANGFFQSKGNIQNIYLNKNVFRADLSVSKSFFGNKLNVSLDCNDIFHSQKDGNVVYNSSMSLYQYNEYDSRQILMTIRYKLNSSKKKYKGNGAGNEEKGRL